MEASSNVRAKKSQVSDIISIERSEKDRTDRDKARKTPVALIEGGGRERIRVCVGHVRMRTWYTTLAEKRKEASRRKASVTGVAWIRAGRGGECAARKDPTSQKKTKKYKSKKGIKAKPL